MSGILHESRTPEYWDHQYRAGATGRPVNERERILFRAHTDPDPIWRAVDVGCGTGGMTAALWWMGVQITGYDFSKVAIDRAREAAAHTRANFVVHDFDAQAIPPELAPKTVDLIVCRHSLEFLDRARFLGDARRWLAPEGIVHITTNVEEKAPEDTRHRGLPDRVVQDLGEGGFRSRTRYDLDDDGSVTCLVLQGPM
ncbi:class I SAM-dependent methyltransferase [Streptomyces sp. NPDC005395]|uniref:class I SAM-dependent methyltransferase n=1 Tax=Streptomyces sp. NPDC005395 TaxID=3157042 RepID=UPI0033BD70A0